MIILSQNSLLAIRRAVLVSNSPIEDAVGHLVWDHAEAVLVAREELDAALGVYLDEGLSWDAVKAANANLARAVHKFEIQENSAVIRRRLDRVAVSPWSDSLPIYALDILFDQKEERKVSEQDRVLMMAFRQIAAEFHSGKAGQKRTKARLAELLGFFR